MTLQSHFQVIVPDMRHLGELPLTVGALHLRGGFADENVDDFIIDDIVLWYKTNLTQ